MRSWWRFAAIGMVAAGLLLGPGSSAGMAQSRAHVYLLRGLLNIFSLGMDSLAAELNQRGVYSTVHNHTEWESLANQAAANYRAGKEGPIILIGHSLGADAVMEMAAYLGAKGIPVALVIPFDGTQSFATPSNVGRLVNLTQREYAYMRRGPGFHGSLANVDVSGDPNIGHISIDKSPRMHARAISEVMAVVGSGHRMAAPGGAKPAAGTPPAPGEAKPASGSGSGTVQPEEKPAAPAATPAPAPKSGGGAMNAPSTMRPLADNGTPVIALPEHSAGAHESATVPAIAAPPRKPAVAPQAATSGQMPD